MERAHDRDEEGEGREYNELHDWGVRGGIVVSGRERWGGNGEVESIYRKREATFPFSSLITDGKMFLGRGLKLR